jgi:hypothetical protein
MSFLDQLGGLLQRYAGIGPQQAPDTVDDDFNQFAQHAPPPALAQGLAEAFRSDQTPPFPQMLGQLFGQAAPEQRAGLLNTLMGAVGPQLLSHFIGGGGQRGYSPEQASQVSPRAIEQLAAQAESHNPGIIDQVSGYFAQHPDLIRTLGSGGLAAVLGGFAGRQQRGDVLPASQDPYGDPADQPVAPASQDPYGDPADQYGGQVAPASQDPYGDPADQPVAPASQDPYGDPADQEGTFSGGRSRW